MKLSNTATIAAVILIVGVGSALAANQSFKDVSHNHWAADAVEWAKDNKVVKGYADGTFGGDKELTRYEMAQMLQNYDQWGLSEFRRDMAQLEQQVNDLQVEAGTRKFGVIKGIQEGENGRIAIELDEMQWFTGEYAKQAMLEDGECAELSECFTPNGYYIRNADESTITLKSVQNANFVLLDEFSGSKTVDLETFKKEVLSENYPFPFWLEDDGSGIYSEVHVQYYP